MTTREQAHQETLGSLARGEAAQRRKQRDRVTDSPIEFNEGDRVIAEGYPGYVARISYQDEDRICVFLDHWPETRKTFGPLSYPKDSPLLQRA